MSVTNIHIKISELQSEIGQALNSAYATGYCNGREETIKECIDLLKGIDTYVADMVEDIFKLVEQE